MRLTMKRNAPKGMMEIRNQGNTAPTMPRQNSTKVTFWSSISACIARRTSTTQRGRTESERVREWDIKPFRDAPVILHLKDVWRKIERGSSPSSMSLENRLRMRPRGVVSKKRMGLRSRVLNSLSCRTEAARTVHCKNNKTTLLIMHAPTHNHNANKWAGDLKNLQHSLVKVHKANNQVRDAHKHLNSHNSWIHMGNPWQAHGNASAL